MSYLNREKLSSLSSDVTLSDSVKKDLVENFYVHSNYRNFKTNERKFDLDKMGKALDKKLNRMFKQAISDAKTKEQQIYRILGIDGVDELQENFFNVNNFQSKFNDKVSIYNLLQAEVDKYNGQDISAITGEQLGNDLQELVKEAKNSVIEMMLQIQDFLTRSDSDEAISKISKVFDEAGKALVDSAIHKKEVDLNKLIKSPGSIIQSSRWQGDTGEIAQYCAGLTNKMVEKVESEITDDFEGKKGKSDLNLFIEDDVSFGLSVKNYRLPTDMKKLDISVHDGKSLFGFIEDIGIETKTAKQTLNFFIYEMVNMLAFTRSGGINPKDRKRVVKQQLSNFPFYDNFISVVQKTAAFWLGADAVTGSAHFDEKEIYFNVAFMIVNGTLIPLSEIYEALKKNLDEAAFNIRPKLQDVPHFGPTVLWEQKQEAISSLGKDNGSRRYPKPLLQIGSSIGKEIANQTKVDIRLQISLNRLIKR